VNSAPKQYFTSTLTVYEALVILTGLTGKNLKDKALVEQITNSISQIKGLTIEPLKPEDLTNATDLISNSKIDYEDAIHLAVATRVGAKEIITNDKDFTKTT
jgi:predicted nucleic acid-binding protein